MEIKKLDLLVKLIEEKDLALQEALGFMASEINTKNKIIDDKDKIINTKKEVAKQLSNSLSLKEIENKEKEIRRITEQLESRLKELSMIYNSRGWKFLTFLHKFYPRDFILRSLEYIKTLIVSSPVHPTDNRKLIMTLLVRDEVDIVEENIKFHLSHGVDFIIATDNGSIDGTKEILKKYEELGKLFLIEEPSQDYSQSDWVNRMGKIAFEKYSAGFVFHCDADEFWYPKSGNLKTEIKSCTKDVIVAEVVNVLLSDRGGEESFPYDTRYAVVNPLLTSDLEKDSLDKNLYIFRYPPKVIFKKNFRVVQGNHDVVNVSERNKHKSRDIIVYHYPLRSKSHFITKVKNGGSAYNANKSLNKKVGWHWRRWYESYNLGTLESEYRRLIINQDEADVLIKNKTIEEFLFKNINK